MATAITPTIPSRTGVNTPAVVACDVTGNTVPNTAGLILMFENADGAAPHNVVFETPVEHAGFDVEDFTLTLAASAKKTLSGFSGDAFGRTLSFIADDTDVKVAAIAVSV
jgi:hypothetical protein